MLSPCITAERKEQAPVVDCFSKEGLTGGPCEDSAEGAREYPGTGEGLDSLFAALANSSGAVH